MLKRFVFALSLTGILFASALPAVAETGTKPSTEAAAPATKKDGESTADASTAEDMQAIEPAAGAGTKNLPETTDEARGATY